MFLEEEASLRCHNATISYNYAGDQGGGVYARRSTWVNSSCDLMANESPQGAALYLTGVENAILENHNVTDDIASGNVVCIVRSSVIATGVQFKLGVPREDSTTRAVQSDSKSTLTCKDCVFDGWHDDDTVIYQRNPHAGSLVLDDCDFSGSSTAVLVVSLNSDATIRNALVGDYTSPSAGEAGNSPKRVNRALNCTHDVCGPGVCVDSTLGVLCECLNAGSCLDDGGEVSFYVEKRPPYETFSPDLVSFELLVSSAGDGTTYTIWNLTFEADGLHLDVAPSSGMLPPDRDVTVTVTGTPNRQCMGGDQISSFNLTSVGIASSKSAPSKKTLEVVSRFYLCQAYEYAVPVAEEVTPGEDHASCEQCASITGARGVGCDSPGATLASLPIRPGFWRSSHEPLVVHECLHSGACVGNTNVSSPDDYCEVGYKGPCESAVGRMMHDRPELSWLTTVLRRFLFYHS